MRISGFSSLFSAIAVVVVPSDKCAENTAITGKIEDKPKSSLISKEKVKKALRFFLSLWARCCDLENAWLKCRVLLVRLGATMFVGPLEMPVWTFQEEHCKSRSLLSKMTNNQDNQIDPWPWYFWKVSRYTSHSYCDPFAKVCPPLGRK